MIPGSAGVTEGTPEGFVDSQALLEGRERLEVGLSERVALPRGSFGEELANTLTHGLGALLALAGTALLLVLSARHGSAWYVVSCAVYGGTLIFLYTASSLYHGLAARGALRLLDHAGIYLLIAGTYTPFVLVNLRGPWGWSLFGFVWGCAALGIGLLFFSIRMKPWLASLPYVAMGWACVVGIRPFLQHVEPGGLWLMLAGGLAYTGGLVFYLWKKLPYHHAIWHLFVLAGSIFHFCAVLWYVIL